jgi:hypothetical protein
MTDRMSLALLGYQFPSDDMVQSAAYFASANGLFLSLAVVQLGTDGRASAY